MSGTVMAGATAYAHKQAAIQRRMATLFINDWWHLLEKLPSQEAPWLEGYDCPAANKCSRLVSNVKVYHLTPPPDLSNDGTISDAADGCPRFTTDVHAQGSEHY